MGFENGIDELFYKKAEEDLDEYVDMILGIEEHLESQFSSPTRYTQWMCDYERHRQNIYDDILEMYEMDCSDTDKSVMEEKMAQGFDYNDLGSAIAYLYDNVLDVWHYDDYLVWDTKNKKRALSFDEREILDCSQRFLLEGKLKEAYELILAINSGDYDGE